MAAELELFFYPRGEAEYGVTLTLRTPDTETTRDFTGAVLFDPELKLFDLATVTADPAGYGLNLGKCLFADPGVRAGFDALREAAGRPDDPPARVRLRADQQSLKLHRLRWELLRRPDATDPKVGEWAFADGRVAFSRHLFSSDLRGVKLRPKSALRAAVVVCSPSNVGSYRGANGKPLPALDIAAELELVQDGLRGLEQTTLTSADRPVTVAAVEEVLRTEPDVLYLVAHGALVGGEPRLFLQKPDGTAGVTPAGDLVDALGTGRTLPRLVVLVSCQSGGGDEPAEDGALAAIGPRLAGVGVAAVLAMQGNLSVPTARLFLPAFFAELSQSGAVDLAAAAGRRAAVSQRRPDAWVPMLFTRLVEGRVWYQAGTTRAGAFNFATLWGRIIQGKCVPILGSGALEPFIGDTREVARALVDKRRHPPPLSSHADIPQVTQYLKVTEGEDETRDLLLEKLADAVRRRWPDVPLGLPAVLNGVQGGAVQTALTAAWTAYQAANRFDPHRYLAECGHFKVIVSTNPDDLMATALRRAGRPPLVHRCDWLRGEPAADSSADLPPASPAQPYLFHLFGQLDEPDSLVLTEDDYFKFLTTATSRQDDHKGAERDADLFDAVRRGALSTSNLLFLGFRIHDWDFRTLFRLLVNMPGGPLTKKLKHVAVQIDPEDGTATEVDQARQYIQKLFAKLAGGIGTSNEDVSVFWGNHEDFLRELDRTCPKTA